MDYCITYFSTAIETTTEDNIQEIVTFSRERNARLNITGVLLYINGQIVQVLEGQQTAVTKLYNSIQQDPRHTQVRTVISRPISHRLFSHWYMGYETLTTQQYDEVSSIISDHPQPEGSFAADQPVILRMLQRFFELNHQS
ncbi:BLUF domain-containing protein [Spirosoma radiotolerans]|uniref:BLUF domain-containing protein n=1 Tax=Spirosoma radiotolerans TaxID=1379870 RepID=UPI000698F620|nr:BLUF domain-containing protein [Spirosoma radiotolerans]